MADRQQPFFNPYDAIEETTNRLPHWEQPGVPCFITFRLADSLPESLLTQWDEARRNWLRTHPEPWDAATNLDYQKRFRLQLEKWLDAGHGSCLLRDRSIAEIVQNSLQCFHENRYRQIASVVMPNHVHLIAVFHANWPMKQVVQGWKSFSSREILKRLPSHPSRKIWQKDYYDRLIRNQEHFRRVVRYIRSNPVRAHLATSDFLLWESDLAKQVD